ncbi:MAG TPA: DNA methyltransferase, partial [Candidatus Angelobacter sp.]|nr:DNA methyltransferase [Candidatus Angelobacter sp.]
FTRSDGNRLLCEDEFKRMKWGEIYRLFRKYSFFNQYCFAEHVRLTEALEASHRLPNDFMLMPPQSWHPDVWTDVTRMRTLNGAQHAKGREMHLCPLQFDIVERLITQFTMEGEEVYDPFGGLMTVPYCAVKLRRRGRGCELEPRYFLDGAEYCRAAEEKIATPTLFDALHAAEGIACSGDEDLAANEREETRIGAEA